MQESSISKMTAISLPNEVSFGQMKRFLNAIGIVSEEISKTQKMKALYLLTLFLLLFSSRPCAQNPEHLDLNILLGRWELDMSPHDSTDSNFAMMHITEVTDISFKGEFYREGVEIRNADFNTQSGIIYGALVSGDGTGEYYTSFYYKDGMLHGSTHAASRNFLSVWTAKKEEQK